MADDGMLRAMDEDRAILPIDVGTLKPWLDGVRPLAELCGELPFLKSEAAAGDFLDQIRRGLADVEAGRVHTTEDVMRELERRRRARRAAA